MSGADLPITPLLWFAATVPLAVILALLVGLKWKAASAAPVGFFITALIAIVLFETSLAIVTAQAVKGVWDALFIAYVIVPALLLYQISDEAGAFGAIRRGIERFSPNNVLHVLAFGWVFSSFLQGITGFGAPVAVVAPLLVAIGVRPLWAVVIPVIGHAWAKSFGTLAVAWEGLGRIVDIPDPAVAAVAAGVMLTAVDVIGALAIAWLFGRMQGVREGLPMILVIGAIHGAGLIVLAPLAANLAVVVPGTLAVGAVLLLARTIYSKPSGVEDSPIMAGADEPGEAATTGQGTDEARPEPKGGSADGRERGAPEMPIWMAFVPYVVLIVLIMAVQLIPLIREPLAGLEVGLSFPATETGYGVPTEETDAYSAFSPLTHPGTFLLLSSLVAFLLYRSRGFIEGGRIDEIGVDTIRTSIPSVMALLALIPLAQVLQGSGMVLELALGIASVATGPIYAFLAPVIGLIGGFLTGSNLSSNILFAPLQAQAAGALEIDQSIVLGAQTAGAAVGGAIALSTVLLGVGAVGASGRSGEVVRRSLPFAAAAIAAIGVITVLAVMVVAPGQASGGGG